MRVSKKKVIERINRKLLELGATDFSVVDVFKGGFKLQTSNGTKKSAKTTWSPEPDLKNFHKMGTGADLELMYGMVATTLYREFLASEKGLSQEDAFNLIKTNER